MDHIRERYNSCSEYTGEQSEDRTRDTHLFDLDRYILRGSIHFLNLINLHSHTKLREEVGTYVSTGDPMEVRGSMRNVTRTSTFPLTSKLNLGFSVLMSWSPLDEEGD